MIMKYDQKIIIIYDYELWITDGFIQQWMNYWSSSRLIINLQFAGSWVTLDQLTNLFREFWSGGSQILTELDGTKIAIEVYKEYSKK